MQTVFQVIKGWSKDPLKNFSHERSGPQSVARAVLQIMEETGKVASFVVADHPSQGGVIRQWFEFGVGDAHGAPCVRWCGEDHDPNGASSHSVIGSGTPESMDAVYVTAVICAYIGVVRGRHYHTNPCIFRVDEED